MVARPEVRDGDPRVTVEAEHDAGHFVRTHVLRPTWHFVPAKDLAVLLAASARRVHQRNGHIYWQFGVDEALMAVARRAFE